MLGVPKKYIANDISLRSETNFNPYYVYIQMGGSPNNYECFGFITKENLPRPLLLWFCNGNIQGLIFLGVKGGGNWEYTKYT